MFWRQTRVFISYRRDDAALHARALHDDLAAAFGRRHVFFDVKDIDYGDAFARIIEENIARSDVVVAVIGPQWLTLPGPDGQPRIRAPRDYVRHEIASALRTGKRLIPVLVGGASLPERAQLPDEIAGLLDLDVITFGDRQLGETANRLVDAIRRESGTEVSTRERWLKRLRWLGMTVAVAMFFAAWLALFDAVGLDTKTASVTLWLADAIVPVAASDEVQMVVIDAQTERALKKPFTRNPAARRDHAELIRRLSQAGARTIAFDLFIVTPSPADDAVLVSAIARARAQKTAVVFGAEDIDDGLPVMLPALRTAVTSAAMLCYGERLGYASTVPLASQESSPTRRSTAQAGAVGLALAAAYPGDAKVDLAAHKVLVAGAAGIHEYAFSEAETVGVTQRCKVGRAGNTVATALYRAAPLAALNHPDRRIPYENVLAMDGPALRARFKDKSVLVGLMMPDDDVFNTFHGFRSEARHGLELHADATGALLADRVVRPYGFGVQFAAMLGLAWFGARVSQWRSPGSTWVPAAVLVGAVVLCGGVAVALCAGLGRLINLTYPVGALVAGYWLAAWATRTR